MSSLSFWVSFFKGAGIPVTTAKSYAASFDDNRITKEMLLDLDKEILREMGIKMMGDIIAILKHAKTINTEEVRKKERAGTSNMSSERSAIKVAPLSTKSFHEIPQVIPSQRAAISLLTHRNEGHVIPVPVVVHRADPVMVNLTQRPDDDLRHSMSGPPLIKKPAPVVIRAVPDIEPTIPYCSLHSDQALQPREPITSRIMPPARSPDAQDYLHEEYTTATYEALKTKNNSSRIVVLPPSLHRRSSDDLIERSKRMLGAAGLIGATEEKRVMVEPKSSVFSRLGVTNVGVAMPTLQTHGVKSRLGSSRAMMLVGEELEEEQEEPAVDHGSSVHSRLGPRKKSEIEDSFGVKKPRQASTGVVLRPTMVADELELGEQVGIHERLELHESGLGMRSSVGKRTVQGLDAERAGKRSVVFQRLF